MEKWMPLILDAALMLMVFWVVYAAARKGFVAAAVDLIGYVASLIGSWFLAKLASQWIFDSVLRPIVLKKVRGVLDEYFTVEQLETELEKVLEDLPAFLTNSMNFELEKVVERFHSGAGIGSDLVGGFTDAIVAPTIVGMMQVVLFLILFSLLLFIVHALSRLLQELHHLPVIGPANSLLGGVVGFVEVILLVFAFTTALHLFFMLTNDSVPWLCSDTVWASNILSRIYKYNPLLR